MIIHFPLIPKTHAQGSVPPSPVTLPNPLNTTDLTVVISSITNWLIAVATPVVAVMVIIGAFQMLFAGGNPEKFNTGKKTIFYSVIGFVVVLLAKGIAEIIRAVATNTAP